MGPEKTHYVVQAQWRSPTRRSLPVQSLCRSLKVALPYADAIAIGKVSALPDCPIGSIELDEELSLLPAPHFPEVYDRPTYPYADQEGYPAGEGSTWKNM